VRESHPRLSYNLAFAKTSRFPVASGATADPLSQALEAPLLAAACVTDGSTKGEPKVALGDDDPTENGADDNRQLIDAYDDFNAPRPSDFTPNTLVAMMTAMSPEINGKARSITSKKLR